MTVDQLEEMRKAFETWYVGNQRITLERLSDGESYKFMAAQSAWITWQSAFTQGQANGVRRCVEICEDKYCELDPEEGTGTFVVEEAIKEAFPQYVKE